MNIKYQFLSGKDYFYPGLNNKTYEVIICNENKKILERVDGFFLIPTKMRLYSDYIDSVNIEKNSQLEFLINFYSKINKPVYDLSEVMKLSIPKYLEEEKYLYWRDDTHWNHYGIFEAMNYVNGIIKK